MRHLKKGRKLGRKKDQWKALMKGLFNSLITKERIKTTEAKAKELRPFAEKLISKSRTKNLAAIRHLARYLTKLNLKKIINQVGPRYQQRPGGYTRIIKLGPRQSDGTKMALIELVK